MSFNYSGFALRLSEWFAISQRDLPWRWAENGRDPYRVLVSEVMLQQTTVKAVTPLYLRFLNRFPTVELLADAPLDDVLSAWQGLGYYSRARNLHACAKAVVTEHGGSFPRALEAVLKLPGVGRYTAGAVTSIAFDAPSPIVDANVARVFARVFCLEGDVKSPAVQKRLWHEAEQVVRAGEHPSQLNPALMELGALICTPHDPKCEACPVVAWCAAQASGRQNELPHATPKRAAVEQRDACLFARRVVDGQERVLLRQRPHEEKVWWRGMWELPRAVALAGEATDDALRRFLRDELGVEARLGARLKTARHAVTHHQIALECWSGEVQGEAASFSARWVEWNEMAALAVPSTMRGLLDWLRDHPDGDGQLSLL